MVEKITDDSYFPPETKALHRSAGKVEMAKKFRSISRLPRERHYPELRNEPPLDSLEKPVPNPLVASVVPCIEHADRTRCTTVLRTAFKLGNAY